MKKFAIALFVASGLCLVGVTASASELLSDSVRCFTNCDARGNCTIICF